MGSGTTALVARQHKRDWLGIELNRRFIDLAHDRLAREA
jgi:DNA modification methylase